MNLNKYQNEIYELKKKKDNYRQAKETKQRNNRNYLDELKQVLKRNI